MEIRHATGTDPDFCALCRELDAYLTEHAGGAAKYALYSPYNSTQDIQDSLVAYRDGQPVAGVAFKPHSPGRAEVKRMYVRPDARRQGVARQLLAALEAAASAQGYTALVLETGRQLTGALRLYRSLGYTVIPNYPPYTKMEKSICLQKNLQAPRAAHL